MRYDLVQMKRYIICIYRCDISKEWGVIRKKWAIKRVKPTKVFAVPDYADAVVWISQNAYKRNPGYTEVDTDRNVVLDNHPSVV